MRLLLDTNVLISAILFGGKPRQLLASALRGDQELVTSSGLLDELEAVLVEKFIFSGQAARAVRTEVEALAELAEPRSVPRVSRDRDDDLVLAAAVAGAVEAIVTGDEDLLALERHEGIPIIRPAQAARRRI